MRGGLKNDKINFLKILKLNEFHMFHFPEFHFFDPKLSTETPTIYCWIVGWFLKVIYDTLHTFLPAFNFLWHLNHFSCLLLPLLCETQIKVQMQLVANVDMDLHTSPQRQEKSLSCILPKRRNPPLKKNSS